jgi:hypothetical protein
MLFDVSLAVQNKYIQFSGGNTQAARGCRVVSVPLMVCPGGQSMLGVKTCVFPDDVGAPYGFGSTSSESDSKIAVVTL